MKKKINLIQWTFIGKYNHAAKWCRPLCSYYLIKEDDKMFIREQKINIFNYILIFIFGNCSCMGINLVSRTRFHLIHCVVGGII